jgi:adenylate kinase family enzyme
LKDKISENPEIAQLIKRSLVAGNLVPDQIINTLVEKRLL